MVVSMFTFATLVSFIDKNLTQIFRKTHQVLFPQSSSFERLYILSYLSFTDDTTVTNLNK